MYASMYSGSKSGITPDGDVFWIILVAYDL